MTLAVGDLANDIECVKLKPTSKIATLRFVREQPLRLLEKELRGIINEWFILHKGRHGEGRVDAASELLVEVVVDGAEQTRLRLALDHGLLHHIEIGLSTWTPLRQSVLSSRGTPPVLSSTHLDIALVQAINRLESCWICERQSVWSEPHHIPMLLMKF